MEQLSPRRFLQTSLALAGSGLLGGCGLLPAPARQPAAVHRLGYLSGRASALEVANLEGLRRGMRDLGYVEGRDFTLETRFAEGQVERSPELAAELVRFPVELIVAVGIVPVRAAKDATSTIPIVMATSNDAVRFGLVASLARPGGNVTGLTSITTQLNGKRLELLKEAVPGVSRVAVLWNPAISERAPEFPEVEAAARALGLQVISLEAREPGELEAAFEAASRQRAEALLTLDNALLAASRVQLAELVTKSRLPTISDGRFLVDAAGLMAYGPDQADQHRRAATFVDKILKGAKPADLPIEQPTKFDFVINLKTAQALGLTIPQSVLMQADEVLDVATVTVPGPPEVTITPPAADLPPELAAYSGTWEGAWDNVLKSRLVVEHIDAEAARVVYAWADHPQGRFKGGWTRVKAKVLPGGRLQWGDPVKFTFEIAQDRMSIAGEREAAGQISTVIMRKVAP